MPIDSELVTIIGSSIAILGTAVGAVVWGYKENQKSREAETERSQRVYDAFIESLRQNAETASIAQKAAETRADKSEEALACTLDRLGDLGEGLRGLNKTQERLVAAVEAQTQQLEAQTEQIKRLGGSGHE